MKVRIEIETHDKKVAGEVEASGPNASWVVRKWIVDFMNANQMGDVQTFPASK